MSGEPCPRCGQTNDYLSKFCSSCGVGLGAQDEPTEGHDFDDADLGSEPHPDIPAALISRQGPTSGARYLLENALTTVGRHPDSEIFLDDITVSRRHAEITHEGGVYVVRDVGSLNGTYVNRVRIDSAVLGSGDELQVGRFKLEFMVRP